MPALQVSSTEKSQTSRTKNGFPLCNWMEEQDNRHAAANENGEYYIREVGDKGVMGFWSRTAYGDGEYSVFAINGNNGKTVALAIDYIF